MKTSNLVTFVMVLALGALVGCGKSKSKKGSGFVCNVNTYCSNSGAGPGQIVDQAGLIAKITELKNHFIAKSVTAGVATIGFQETIFYVGGVQSSQQSFLGLFDFTSNSWKQSCEFTRVASNGVGLDIARASNNCNSVPSLPGLTAYDPASNVHLEDALNTVPQQIYQRGVAWSLNGGQATQSIGYSIITTRNFGTEYIEYVVVPDMPSYLNPVAYRNMSTGAVRQLNGIQFF